MTSQIQAVKYLCEIMPKDKAFLSCSAYLLNDGKTVEMRVNFTGDAWRVIYYHLPVPCSLGDFAPEAASKMFIALLKHIGGR